MTLEQQRIAIAEAYGWTEISMRCLWGLPPGRVDCGTENCLKHLPDYLNDLNAMREAEKCLNYDQCEQYASDIWAIIMCAEERMENPPPSNFACLHATAVQRAEAFLSTLGLWVGEQPELNQ